MAVHRGRLLRDSAAAEFVLFAVAVVIAVVAEPMGGSARVGVAFVLAVALGLQNTSVRRLAVPDLTTTVLTMTITGIAADIKRSSYAVALRRPSSGCLARRVVTADSGAGSPPPGCIQVTFSHNSASLGNLGEHRHRDGEVPRCIQPPQR